MAITTAMCNSFKRELLGGVHDLDTDTLRIALLKEVPAGSYNNTTTNYSNVTANSDEVIGTNYVAGGNILSGAAITLSGATAIVDFSDTTWSLATISSSGCIIYNATKANAAIAVINFGGIKTSTNGDFTVVFPAADSSNAIVRIS